MKREVLNCGFKNFDFLNFTSFSKTTRDKNDFNNSVILAKFRPPKGCLSMRQLCKIYFKTSKL